MRATAPGRPITHNGPRPVAPRGVAPAARPEVDPSGISGVHTDPEISLAQILDGFEPSRVSNRSQVSNVSELVAAPRGSAYGEDVIAPQPPATSRKTLARGSLGLSVRRLQRQLVKLGHLSHDTYASGAGVFGPRTEQAVRAFQLQVGLKPSGQVDALTELALQQSPRA